MTHATTTTPEPTNEYETTFRATKAAQGLYDALEADEAAASRVRLTRTDDVLGDGNISLRLTTNARHLDAASLGHLADHGAAVEYLGRSDEYLGREWLLFLPAATDEAAE